VGPWLISENHIRSQIFAKFGTPRMQGDISFDDSDLLVSDPSQLYRDTGIDLIHLDRIQALIKDRAKARYAGNYEDADSCRDKLNSILNDELLLEKGYTLNLMDIPRRDGGGSHWEISNGKIEKYEDSQNGASVLEIAHSALGLASLDQAWLDVADFTLNSNNKDKELERYVNQAINKLEIFLLGRKYSITGSSIDDKVQVKTVMSSVPPELFGRKAADAAFYFSLAGCKNAQLFEYLASTAKIEMLRYGRRQSCRAVDIQHVVERMAVAGIRSGKDDGGLFNVASELLAEKENPSGVGCGELEGGRYLSTDARLLSSGKFSLHSTRPLMCLWSFMAKQRKQKAFLKNAVAHYCKDRQKVLPNLNGSWLLNREDNNVGQVNENNDDMDGNIIFQTIFEDSTRPLVVDVGCGVGVSLLGLATLDDDILSHGKSVEEPVNIDWEKCNFLGIDLSKMATGYANGISYRWGLNGKLKFVNGSAESFLQKIKSTYPGEVKLIMIQFPTPFKFCGHDSDSDDNEENTSGNSQLPSDQFDGFMVTKTLMMLAHDILEKSKGSLLLQSNCEDVAVHIRDLATEEAGFQVVNVPNCVNLDDKFKGRKPKRMEKWIDSGGKRAEGLGWSRLPLIPLCGATEAEISCIFNQIPVHTCILSA